jgi:decaprenylphospho-beta-D-erythro-pentofuranosid-2-ulose 2-reductase
VAVRAVAWEALDFAGTARMAEALLASEGERLAGVVVAVGALGDPEAARHDAEAARRLIDLNLTAVVALLTSLADALERRGGGFICVLSSVAGERGRQSNYLYGAAKGGLSLYLQGLRNRLHPAGVQVLTVKPGFVDTRMTFGLPGTFLVASPERIARGTLRALRAGRDVVYLPGFWRPLMFAIRALPERLFKRLEL